MLAPWLSVIIPVYNGDKYISHALDSVLAQRDEGIECIVVDAGSDDATVRIVLSYSEKLEIRLFQGPHRNNWAANSNYGLHKATAEYACFLCHDDLWMENRLKLIKPLVFERPECAFYFHSARFIDDAENDLGPWRCPVSAYPALAESKMMIERLMIQNFIAMNAPIFKRSTAMELKGLDETLWYTADWDFWLKLAATGPCLYYPEALAKLRVHPASQTIRRTAQGGDFQDQMDTVLNRHLRAHTWLDRSIIDAARYSVRLNVGLAAAFHGRSSGIFKLMIDFAASGPVVWYRFFRDSRILERVFARIRAGVWHKWRVRRD